MSACHRSAGRLFWTCSCKTSVSVVAVGLSDNTRPWYGSWQNAADDDLRRRLTDSRRPDRLEPCRTVTGRPGWPSWNSPDVELEASAAPVALAWCDRTVERPTSNVQPHSGQTAAGSWDLRRCRKTMSCSSPGDTKWTPEPAFYGLG